MYCHTQGSRGLNIPVNTKTQCSPQRGMSDHDPGTGTLGPFDYYDPASKVSSQPLEPGSVTETVPLSFIVTGKSHKSR